MARLTAILLLVLGVAAALPASAGDLLRYRLPDGTVGLTDDPSKLPAGAVVESRRKAAPPPAPPAAASPAAETPSAVDPPADPPGDPSLGEGPGADEARRERADRCRHFALPPTCSRGDLSRAGMWAARGRQLREAVTQAEDDLASWEEAYDRCDRSTGRIDCPRGELERARKELAARQKKLDELEEDCRSEDCQPGWLRTAPEPE
ncbi:MAG TPA: hypothetical protein VMW35_15270 [Myxococcota bacterium]|jgi:hypothetical protein|nr:hypothetical protein [Myxococcota bacterium]